MCSSKKHARPLTGPTQMTARGRSGVCKGRRSARASLPAGLLPGRRTGDSSGPLRPETVYADSDWTFDAGASPGYGAAHAIALRAAPRYSGFVDATVLHAAGFERRIDDLRSYHHFTLCKRVVRRPGIHTDEQLAGWRSPVVVSLPCQELSIARQSAISRLGRSAISMNRIGTQLALTMALIPRARNEY